MSTIAKNLRGTETEKNIVAAYMSESAAYSRYTYYAQQADKENYFPIGQIFRETADNELHHGKVFFKMLQGGKVPSVLAVDSGIIGTTEENLATAAEEEKTEGVEQYTKAAEVADKEGFPEVAAHFRAIAEVEMRHRARFEHFLKQVKEGTVWTRKHPVKWQCLVCGYIYEGTEPPKVCPACDHPYQHYIALDYDMI
ncbi:MAG: rubrerythrin family protein [Muribaculaceae bacterium]|nr:rubrerythrin family protein [Muribaculaceae bacterium]